MKTHVVVFKTLLLLLLLLLLMLLLFLDEGFGGLVHRVKVNVILTLLNLVIFLSLDIIYIIAWRRKTSYFLSIVIFLLPFFINAEIKQFQEQPINF
jgi:hypothetical protein